MIFDRLHPVLSNSLLQRGIIKPTWIQQQALPLLIDKKCALLASEPGTGKTLAYLLPIVNSIMYARHPLDIVASGLKLPLVHSNDSTSRINNMSPFALILTPTRGLMHQIMQVILSLDLGISVSTAPVSPGLKRMFSPDICVSQCDLIQKTYKKHKQLQNLLARTETVVMDEADYSIAQGAGLDLMVRLQQVLKKRDPPVQIVFSAATMKQYTEKKAKCPRALISKVFPDIVQIDSPHLHTTGNVEELFYNLKGDAEKLIKLEKILSGDSFAPTSDISAGSNIDEIPVITETESAEISRKLVFCSTGDRAEMVHDYLERHGKQSTLVHAGTPDKHSSIQEFLHGTIPILVCTDVCSRGIDFRNVGAVVHFDSPREASVYAHRVGRVQRANGEQTGGSSHLLGGGSVFSKLVQHADGSLGTLLSRRQSLSRRAT